MGVVRYRITSLRIILVGLLLASIVVPPCAYPQSTTANDAAVSPNDDTDRPVLRHQSGPIAREESATPPGLKSHSLVPRQLTVANGLALPVTGYIWALDKFGGKPQLVQLKYVLVDVNRHIASNQAKVQLAPFIYKPKATLEIKGAAAAVRIHDTMPPFFIRARFNDVADNAADPAASTALGNLALVKVKVHGERRIVSTIAFTQIKNKAHRYDNMVETTTERLGSEWYKMTPKEPLPPGEYALVRLPERQDLFSPLIFDFAIDPNGPQNSVVVVGESEKKE